MLATGHHLSSRSIDEILHKTSNEYYKTTMTTTDEDSHSIVSENKINDNSSVQIMSESNFPDIIKYYLDVEKDVIYNILLDSLNLSPNKQILLVEVGCGKGEYLDTICKLNNKIMSSTNNIIQYFGIDLCPLLVDEGKQRIIKKQVQSFAQIQCMNILHLNLDTKSDQIVFVLFPFNLFGNFNSDEMSSIYSHFLDENCCFLISAYLPNEESKLARKIYYEQCFGQDHLEYYEVTTEEEGCLSNELITITENDHFHKYQHISQIFYVPEKLRTIAWCEKHFMTLMEKMSLVDICIRQLNLTNIATMYVINKII